MKTNYCHLFTALTLVTGVHVLAQTTPLNIALEGNQVVLSWPVTTTSWILQGSPSLSPVAWSTNLPGTVVVNGQNTVSISISGTEQFYELRGAPVTVPAGMVLIPAGSFTMGDTLDREPDAIPITVTVSAFYMDMNLVSYSQWQSIYSYATNNGYSFDLGDGLGKATNHPVQTVDWYDCVKWCNALSQQTGLKPVYYTDSGLTQVYTNGDVDLTVTNVNWSANGYRLPTEAEWEKAARGGVGGNRFPWGDTISESQANYQSNTNIAYDLGPNGFNANYDTGGDPFTSPVGSFPANGYGLFDMAGNVFEWCGDWYGRTYGQPTATNPTGPATGITATAGERMLRGGNWFYPAPVAGCAYRSGVTPDVAKDYIGFRCVRGL